MWPKISTKASDHRLERRHVVVPDDHRPQVLEREERVDVLVGDVGSGGFEDLRHGLCGGSAGRPIWPERSLVPRGSVRECEPPSSKDHATVSGHDVPDPVLPGPEGVIVTVEHTAICGSDLHLYHDAPTGAGIRLGHEAIGTVADAGPQVRTLKPGDRVLVSGVIGCGVCGPCLAGHPNVCLNDKAAAFGTIPDLPGGQAEAMAVPFADLFALPIPEGVADEEAVLLTDILPTGYLGALRAAIRPGATVVVVGLGPVGIMALQCASLFGPGPHPRRRHGARTPGPCRAARGRADRRPDRAGVRAGHGGDRRAGRRVGH